MRAASQQMRAAIQAMKLAQESLLRESGAPGALKVRHLQSSGSAGPIDIMLSKTSPILGNRSAQYLREFWYCRETCQVGLFRTARQGTVLSSQREEGSGCVRRDVRIVFAVYKGALPPDDRVRGPRSARSMTYWSMPVRSDRRVGCLENG